MQLTDHQLVIAYLGMIQILGDDEMTEQELKSKFFDLTKLLASSNIGEYRIFKQGIAFCAERKDKEIEALKLELLALREALEATSAEVRKLGLRGGSVEISDMRTEALTNSAESAARIKTGIEAAVLETFATKWLPHMKQKDSVTSIAQTTHNIAVDDCIRHAFSMANELREQDKKGGA